MSLTLKELSALNRWITAKVRYEMQHPEKTETARINQASCREMQAAWDDLCDLAVDCPGDPVQGLS